MNSEELVNIVVDALEDIKAYDIDVINVSKITSMFEYIVIASADSSRQTKSLANNVQEKVKAAGGRVYSMEGEQTGEWLLVDLGDVIVHIMLPVAREYYNLKALWSGQN
ncbi:MAG: ribosome silencing factor [Nitrosomonas sp.]|jgi:ribosome-associated protein|uniref:ribosome silencing factor n=1 Tax=Nitrosomonas sp. TaxID=42353 RepID=UPI00273207FA|nr:ribosome silencing factor [Nitrosomonas sp.]MBK6958624.1 ribosome silencing factor [Nitrosomonas sp.]MDP1551192.1 ribosome silencing factor [Nitrosomonas sp.]MDP1933941.1 ribosome silencing factor [Nitrosomonas sp.]MDP3282047.1 ribosome silencing factor [Nitrosomonas sp.]MDP3664767.1 ribosome silencing factor [Nitrosomonas sp.]